MQAVAKSTTLYGKSDASDGEYGYAKIQRLNSSTGKP